jgi:malate dehydrogenase (oxaloacetate-decarboxylating)(NADP+)
MSDRSCSAQAKLPAHVLSTSSVTSRGVVNMAALAVVEASQPTG